MKDLIEEHARESAGTVRAATIRRVEAWGATRAFTAGCEGSIVEGNHFSKASAARTRRSIVSTCWPSTMRWNAPRRRCSNPLRSAKTTTVTPLVGWPLAHSVYFREGQRRPAPEHVPNRKGGRNGPLRPVRKRRRGVWQRDASHPCREAKEQTVKKPKGRSSANSRTNR